MKTGVKNRLSLMFLCGLLLSGLLLQGCFSSSKHRRGKLSDALEKTSDTYEGDRRVETTADPEPDEAEDDEREYDNRVAYISAANAQGDSITPISIPIEPESASTWLIVSGGTGTLPKENFTGLNHFNIGLGGYLHERHYVELAAGLSWAPFQETSKFSQSLDGGVFFLNLGGNYKYFTSPSFTLMAIYFSGGIHYTYMRWSYKNPFEAMNYDEYGNETGMETINSDGLSGFEVSTGIGLNLLQTERFQFGTEVLPGLMFWFPETSEGFDNDIFGTFYFLKFKLLVHFRIK